ncbi:MAG: alpha-L-fucosidase [Armatimonadetes bacterium]|nr:alpha-L-fucosidase [Armatimonadota bacterium]
MRRELFFAIALLSTCFATAQQPYQQNWESLSKHNEAPEWFRDAKFGIYFHWGVYSVPAFGSEWYPRNMYLKGSSVNKHHIETWGDPSEFGYEKFVPLFRAEKFDADEWADLFVKSGAKFAGPVAEHHDGFAMWDSDVTPWNAADMGPKRDITGELAKAIRARGMKFVTSFHHARNSLWQNGGNWTGHYDGAYKNYPSVLEDAGVAQMFGYMPRKQFLDAWYGKLEEVIDQYQPDIIWFDSWLDQIDESYQQRFLQHYFNSAAKWGKEVVVTTKGLDFPRDVAVEDFEKGRADDLTPYPWLTDDTLSWGSWSYTENLEIKTAKTVIHTLIDIVSKNGQLLLNISPMADGTIPGNQRKVLREIGLWLLFTNGEAIYNTRPWLIYGEGPTQMRKGGHFVGRVDYTREDIRYTQSKDGKTLYAIMLGVPNGDVTLKSVSASGITNVSMLGIGQWQVDWSSNELGQLVIQAPDLVSHFEETPLYLNHSPKKLVAYVFVLTGPDFEVHPDAMFGSNNVIRLSAENAVVEGGKAGTETHGELTNIGFWNDANEKLHWLAYIKKPGEYRVRGTFATASGETKVRLSVEGQSVDFEIPNWGDWRTPQVVKPSGTIRFEKPGVYKFTLAPTPGVEWHAINVFSIELAPPLGN